jgi:hypothetical protein
MKSWVLGAMQWLRVQPTTQEQVTSAADDAARDSDEENARAAAAAEATQSDMLSWDAFGVCFCYTPTVARDYCPMVPIDPFWESEERVWAREALTALLDAVNRRRGTRTWPRVNKPKLARQLLHAVQEVYMDRRQPIMADLALGAWAFQRMNAVREHELAEPGRALGCVLLPACCVSRGGKQGVSSAHACNCPPCRSLR